MSITSDRFCVYLRKDTDNDDLLKFINGQKSLSASIRLLIKAYMATAKTLDVESADLFDVINAVSAKNLGLLDPNVVASERLADKNRSAKIVSNDDMSYEDGNDVESDEVVDDGDDNIVDTDVKEVSVREDHHIHDQVGADDTKDSGGSINDFMGDF